jgi:hypothetical protein
VPVTQAPGIKLGRSDTTFDLSRLAERIERKDLGERVERSFYRNWERNGESNVWLVCGVCGVCLLRKGGSESRGLCYAA